MPATQLSPAEPTEQRRQDKTFLAELFAAGDPGFFPALRDATQRAERFEETIFFSTLRKKASKKGVIEPRPETLRLAVVGGCSLYPLRELIEHFVGMSHPEGLTTCNLFVGDYDNYVTEIIEQDSGLYRFQPDAVFLIPRDRSCIYRGSIADSRETQEAQAKQLVDHLLDLCRTVHERTKAEVILSNFALPGRFDPGPFRTRTLGSDWSFRKKVNLELGLAAPPYVHICDTEFLSCRRGTVVSADPRGWFESKQPWAPDLMLDVAREVGHVIAELRKAPKKVLVVDLDNTLWGGVVGDDGLDGIEIGDTAPAAEAFKAFQQYVLSLTERGVLLGVCSKNDHEKAAEPFEKHPDMVLKMKDFVSFKANWNPKSDNIRQMAAELNLGLDSFVFVDDNPAEIEIMRQFAPQVAAIHLGDDPSRFVAILQDSRLFEPRGITKEDAQRTEGYKQQIQREELLSSCTDMDSYLRSLKMKATISEFAPVDVVRIAQLINKSNQFNLTTRRRTESEVQALVSDPNYAAFTVRLEDKFGDYGLISVVICRAVDSTLQIDTWLMSCRVLNRQVEEEVVNEIARAARSRNLSRIQAAYLPTSKNGMVKDLLPRMGFHRIQEDGGRSEYELDVASYTHKETRIEIA